jgi:hypothetical protein
MDTPRETNLYRKIAKDYTPKAAEMQICRYIEALETRIHALEKALAQAAEKPAEKKESKSSGRK